MSHISNINAGLSCRPEPILESLVVDADYQTGYQLVEANIIFLKKGPDYRKVSPKNGETKPVKIRSYSDVTKLRNDFTLHKNGFQYCALSSPLMQALDQFVKSPSLIKNRADVLNQANQFLSSWGKEIGIPGIGVPINITYRATGTTDPLRKPTAPFFFAHADYHEPDIGLTMQANKKVWKRNIETVTGPLTEEAYAGIKIHTMLNLWMPLNELPTVNTLAIMDKNVENLSEQLRPALTPVTGGSVTSLGLRASENQTWVVQKMMTRGSGVIFLTMKTPHTAIDASDRFQGELLDEHRESVEVRCLWAELPVTETIKIK